MNDPEAIYATFGEMVRSGDLKEVEMLEKVREQRRRLKGHFALVVELGLEEVEEPEED